MAIFCVVLWVFLLYFSDASPALHCGKNEQLEECAAPCDYDYCPKSAARAKVCEQPTKCPQPVCKCIIEYRRAVNGTCIPVTDCLPFDCSHLPNEEYDPCPLYCPTDDCKYANSNGVCPFSGFLITNYCTPACRCIKGFWRQNGVCVPKKQCN